LVWEIGEDATYLRTEHTKPIFETYKVLCKKVVSHKEAVLELREREQANAHAESRNESETPRDLNESSE
jgi:hypothetical protein